jgi:outer membrane protein assembly factor BamE (lipoprotein component of BamABCDE complex)
MSKNIRKNLLILNSFLLLFLLTGCASNPIEDFSKISVGMDKTEVIDRIGSPIKSEMFHGIEYWTYKLYSGPQPTIKEVHFKDGIVTFSGDPIPDAEKKSISVKTQKELKTELLKEKKKKTTPVFKDVESSGN